MNTKEFDELAGRIQATADMVCLLIAVLDKQGVIYAPDFGSALYALAENRRSEDYQESARQTSLHLAKQIEEEHDSRQ